MTKKENKSWKNSIILWKLNPTFNCCVVIKYQSPVHRVRLKSTGAADLKSANEEYAVQGCTSSILGFALCKDVSDRKLHISKQAYSKLRHSQRGEIVKVKGSARFLSVGWRRLIETQQQQTCIWHIFFSLMESLTYSSTHRKALTAH